jgi:ribosome maturation factor RimP
MRVKRIFSQVLAGTILLLFTMFVAACGSSSAAAGTTTTVTATATATSCLSQATGTIQSINGTTLLVTNLQGKDVQVTLTSKTTFIRQATLTPADLKDGMPVSVLVTQNTDNTYSARTVNVRNSLTRQGGFTSGLRLCNGQRFRGTGTPGAFSGPGFGSGTPGSVTGQSRQTINGTVSQVNANSLTVTDASSNDFTVNLTTTTRISAQQTVTASDLHSGEAVTITGSANSQGVINASSVSILQGLPNRRATPTPTPGT